VSTAGERETAVTASRPHARTLLRAFVVVGTLVAVSAAAIAIGLLVTPSRSVSALGQTVEVGATPPSLGASGPGEVVLFGRTLPTEVHFVGPVRPRLVLTDITLDAQVAGAFAPPGQAAAAAEVGDALSSGWRTYFLWQIAVVGAAAVVLLGAIAGWRRYDHRRTLITIVGGLVFVQVVNVSLIMVTAFTAPGVLRQVGSLNELVGREQVRPVAAVPGPTETGVQAIVIGDSVAAGLGGPPIADASPEDIACERSSFAFAETLAAVNDWRVENLACSGATIDRGVLGAQRAGDRRLPPQLAAAQRIADPEVVIVNVGANDMHWSSLVFLCGVADACDSRALTAYFQRSLDDFTQDYYELLRQLAALPGDPLVLINRYYAPFDPALDCLEPFGLTRDKLEVLLERLDALNEVIETGAETFGYRAVQPDFTGHELCTDAPYVQDPDDRAPLHPNARGQLVIALADERALLEAE
jgi:lysophospholipase L1-like esterase